MGEVDQVHDAEHQGQSGGKQEQHHPELEPVERLFGDEDEVHQKKGALGAPDRSSPQLPGHGYHFILQSLP